MIDNTIVRYAIERKKIAIHVIVQSQYEAAKNLNNITRDKSLKRVKNDDCDM